MLYVSCPSVIAPSLTGELGFEDYIRITAVCVLSGLLSGYIMLFAARELVFWSYLRGMNPDNVAAPFVTALGTWGVLCHRCST